MGVKMGVMAAAFLACCVVGRAAPGELVVVPLGDPPKVVRVKTGDLVQFELSYPVIPDKMVSGLKVEVGGRAMSCVAVVDTPPTVDGKRVVGAGAVSAFIKAERPGEARVRITPHRKGAEAIEIRVIVERR
jgi:hypothetical protein